MKTPESAVMAGQDGHAFLLKSVAPDRMVKFQLVANGEKPEGRIYCVYNNYLPKNIQPLPNKMRSIPTRTIAQIFTAMIIPPPAISPTDVIVNLSMAALSLKIMAIIHAIIQAIGIQRRKTRYLAIPQTNSVIT